MAYATKADLAPVQSIARGAQLPAGEKDWASYFQNFIQRQGMTRSWAAADSLLSAVDGLQWRLSSWVVHSATAFEYQRSVQNLDVLFALLGLRLDLKTYCEGRLKFANCYDDDDVTHISVWDVYMVNEVADLLDRALDLGENLLKNPPEAIAGLNVDLVGAVTETLPILREFQTYYPEFCAVLNQANIIDLTEKPRQKWSPPKLKIDLPSAPEGMQRSVELPFAKIAHGQTMKFDRAASDFQGFFIGIVQEPGTPDDRDAVNCYTSPEELERSCDDWALNSGKVGINHEEIPDKQGREHPHFILLRNWIQYGDTVIGSTPIKHGTWLQAYQTNSEWAWNAVRNYELNSLSNAGSARYLGD